MHVMEETYKHRDTPTHRQDTTTLTLTAHAYQGLYMMINLFNIYRTEQFG